MAGIKLKDFSTRAPTELNKEDTKAGLAIILEELNELQNRLYAESKHAVLVVLQGMDASGKDGVIRKVFGSLNPQGVTVKSYKVPTPEELSRDFLWRIHKEVPPKGMIQIFNRSHYEDILVTRVHDLINDEIASQRMTAINNFEQLLTKHGNTVLLKFYLHISPEEQQKRLAERQEDPTKQWKYNARDLEEAKLWNRYMKMYEDCFERCNIVEWNIIPADQNWYKEYLIAKTLLESMRKLDSKYPAIIP